MRSLIAGLAVALTLAAPAAASAEMEVVGTWGSLGNGSGQLHVASGVAVAGDGAVYVSDTNRIARLTANGTGATLWGSYGSGNGQFNHPYGVAVGPGGTVYVADSDNNRIQHFTPVGATATDWGSFGASLLNRPNGVAVAPDGDSVYVADTGHNRVEQLRIGTGASVRNWGSPGSAPGQFDQPTGIAVAPDGTVYVADLFNDRIQQFTPTGTFVRSWGTFGTAPGQFKRPIGVAVAPDGTVYVADGYNDRIQRFADIAVTLDGSDGTFTLANRGGIDVPITAITVSGPDADQFTGTGGDCPTGATLRAGETCTVVVAARPTRSGVLQAQLRVDAALGTWSRTYTADLTAEGPAPARPSAPITPEPPAAAPSVPVVAPVITPVVTPVVTPTPPARTCVVPDLRSRTISAARRLARAADCALGRVHRTKARRGAPTPRVVAQRLRPATQRPAGTRIAVTTRTRHL
jgi:streptogramin lyase